MNKGILRSIRGNINVNFTLKRRSFCSSQGTMLKKTALSSICTINQIRHDIIDQYYCFTCDSCPRNIPADFKDMHIWLSKIARRLSITRRHK